MGLRKEKLGQHQIRTSFCDKSHLTWPRLYPIAFAIFLQRSSWAVLNNGRKESVYRTNWKWDSTCRGWVHSQSPPLASLKSEFITKLKKAYFIFFFSKLYIYTQKHICRHTQDRKSQSVCIKSPLSLAENFSAVSNSEHSTKPKSREEYFETCLVFRGFFPHR